MTARVNHEFEIRGVNHLALVCKDMARTVEFYRDVLGMPLTKTIDLPSGMGQHFFFDIGNGDSLAFFWFPNAPSAQPGVSNPGGLPGHPDFVTAHASLNHDNSKYQVSADVHEGVFVRSVYFFDPDGVCLEFACWMREFDESDVAH